MALPAPLFFRATAVTAGTVIAVLPLLACRILLVIGAESLQLDTGFWTKLFYLPWELLFPFILSSSLLHRQPDITSSSLTLKTLLTSIASSPFMVAIFTLLVTLDASGQQSFMTTLVTISGLAPFLGVLGLAGFLLLCFPLTLFGGGIAGIVDYFVCRRYRQEIDTIRFEQQFSAQTLSFSQRVKLGWQRLKAKFSRRQSIEHYTEITLKEEFERYRTPLFRRLADIAKHIAGEQSRDTFRHQQRLIMLHRLREQLLSVEQKTLRFHELLKQRLHVGELTFYRYSGSVKNVYYAVMDHLDKASSTLALLMATDGRGADMTALGRRIDENERAIQSIDALIEAIHTLPQLPDYQSAPLHQSMADLESMIERVGDYRSTP